MSTPQPEPPGSLPEAPHRVGYYMVKIRRLVTELPGGFAGVVERLGSGEKREFKSCDELARVVDEWSR